MHSNHATSTAEALFRVFVSNVPYRIYFRRMHTTQWRPRSLLFRPTIRQYSPRAQYNDPRKDEADDEDRQNAIHPRPRRKKIYGPADTRRYNERIQSEYVRVLDDTDGTHRVRALKSVLAEIDRKTQCVMQTSPNDSDELPVVRIMSSREARDKDKSREKSSRHNPSSASKQIELTWMIGPNDLDNMMNQLKGFLEDGKRVEIGIGRNKRKGQAKRQFTIEQARAVLNGVRERIGKIEGAAEYKEMEQGKGAAVLFVESKAMRAEADRRRRETEREKEEARKRRLEEKERRRLGQEA